MMNEIEDLCVYIDTKRKERRKRCGFFEEGE